MTPAPELHSQIDAEKHEEFDEHGRNAPKRRDQALKLHFLHPK